MPTSPPSTLRRASDSIARRLYRGQQSPTDEHATTLHRAWGIDDVVRLILQHCELPDAVALGRTCSYLFCLCIEVVWEQCRDLNYLQRQAFGGRDAVAMVYRKLQSTPLTSRSFRLDTQTRMALYCARIRSISVDQHAIDTDPLHALSKYMGSTFLQSNFPQLRRVALTIFNNKALETGVDFVTELPGLQYVGVYHRAHFVDWPVDDTSGHPTQRRLPTTFRALQRLPRLDFLRLQVDDGRQEQGGEAFAFVDGLTTTNLEPRELRLRFANIKSPYLPLLEKFTTLRSLECSLDGKSIIPNTMSLPRLQQLMIASRSIQAFEDFIKRLNAPLVDTLQLKPEHASEMYDPPYQLRAFHDLFKTIARKWPELQRFCLSYRAPLAAPQMVYWDFRALYPFFACTHLKSFIINSEPWLLIRDEDVPEVVAAWPELEVFVVGGLRASQAYRPMWQSLTYESLTALASCPDLRTLVLLNVYVGDPRAHIPPRSPWLSRLRTVILREPQNKEEKQLGMTFLRQLFPLLTLTRQASCPRCGIDRRLERKGEHWVLERKPPCCLHDVAGRLGLPGIDHCLSVAFMQKKIQGDCILCQMDMVSNFETFAEWSNMYGP